MGKGDIIRRLSARSVIILEIMPSLSYRQNKSNKVTTDLTGMKCP